MSESENSKPTEEEKAYIEYIKECKDKGHNVMISNGSIKHATILIPYIIESAERKISLLTGSCDDDFYTKDPVLSQFLKFIDDTNGDGKIEIVYEADTGKSKGFIEKLTKRYLEYKKPCNLTQYEMESSELITDDDGKNVLHFIVVDDDGPFRFEKHSTQEDQKSDIIEAKANFGNKRISKSLQTLFTQIRAQSKVINN